MILFFYQHFTWLCGHEIIKEFKKYILFWKYDNCFSSEVSKLTSVRNKLNLPMKYWFMEAKYVCRICYGPKNWPKYPLNTIQTSFSENNNYIRVILVKIIFFSCLKMHYFRGILPKSVLTPLKKTSYHIFQKLFGDLMSHIIKQNAGKNILKVLNFSPSKFLIIELWPFCPASLHF